MEENIGYGIYNVSIQDSGMPREDVSNAFKAVEDAKQGMETAINTAKKYQSENIPKPMQRPISSYRRRRPISSRGSTRPTDRWHV